MLPFRLQKWYFDVLTGEQEYLFGYLAMVRLAGLRQQELVFTVARPGFPAESVAIPLDGKLCTEPPFWSGWSGRQGKFSVHQTGLEVRLNTSDLHLGIQAESILPQPDNTFSLTIPAGGSTAVLWTPLHLHARFAGEVFFRGKSISLRQDSGYVDFVDSNVLPLLSPVRKLFWGRFHRHDAAVTYTVYCDARGQVRGRVILRSGRERLTFIPIQLIAGEERYSKPLRMEYPRRLILRGSQQQTVFEMVIQLERIAVESTYFDAGSQKLLPVWRFFSRNPRGVKFWGRASYRLQLADDERTGEFPIGIGEFVRFS